MKNKKSVYTQILLVIAILVIINFISFKFFFRLDFTSDGRYTLSEATKDILHSLDEPVTITAYFTEELPPDIAIVRRDFKDLLVEYNSISKGDVVYEFINPNKDQESEQLAFKAGIQPVIVSSRERDESVQKKVFLGAVIQKGEQKEVVPFIQPGSAMEYALTTGIKKIAVIDKPVIGIVQGNGEPSIQAMAQVMQSLSILYAVEPVQLDNPQLDLTKYKALAIVGSKDTINPNHFQVLDSYLANGGNLFIAMDRVDGNLQTLQGTSVETGLEVWLAQKGLVVENNFVVDNNSGTVGVQQKQGPFNFTTPVKFPYLVNISNFAEHPITKGIEEVILPFVSSITYTGDTSKIFTPLAMTSEKSGTQNTPVYFDINKKWNYSDYPLSNIPVGAILEGRLVGNTKSTIVLIADGQFPVNGEGQRPQQLSENNVSLMVNSIDWLSDDTGLIDLRTRGVSSRPLDQVEDGTKTMLKWLNFSLPILLILIYGIFRNQRKRSIRVKRMEQGYI